MILGPLMRRGLAVLSLVGAVACSRATGVAVAPAPAPVPEAERAAPASAKVAESPPPADLAGARAEPEARATSTARPRSPVDAAAADTTDQAFLDSLRAMPPDSLVHTSVSVAPEAVQQEAANLLGTPAPTTWDIDVTSYAMHSRVLYWMDYFTGPARGHFEQYLTRLGRYESMIRARLAAGGLPRDMIYLAMIESGFNANARSRAGAVGMWQFMPSTGRRYGLTVDAWVDERRDPFLSTDAAVRFLNELNGRFGSMYLAAAAYNGGPGRVERGLRRGDFGTLEGDQVYFAMADDGGRYFHRETRDYVPKLIAAALLAKEPDRYGFTDIDRWSPLAWDSVEVPFAVGLDVVARLASVPTGDVEDLNPQFYRGVTPPDRRVWLRVPRGTGDTVTARLAALPPRDRVTIVTHIVEHGENLSIIAHRYGVTVADLKSANHLSSSRLQHGQRLIVPAYRSRTWQRGARPPEERRPRASRSSSSRGTTHATRSSGSAQQTRSAPASSRHVHVVRSGETMNGIANQFHVPLSSLLSANGMSTRSVIHPGQTVRIPN